MSSNTMNRWGVALLMMVGCGSKLQVDTVAPGMAPEGGLGQPCISHSVVTEVEGTFAQADIGIPAHCSDGLNCRPDGLCAPIPDCPQTTGLCFIRRSGDGGAAGAADVPWDGGEQVTFINGMRVERVEPSVQQLVTNGSILYWAEYGSRDSTGQYQNDGRVMAFDDHKTEIVSNLPGPIGLGITTSHAYIYIDGAAPIGSPVHYQLLRARLLNGKPELVQDELHPSSFVSTSNGAIWDTWDGNLYQMPPDSTAMASIFPASPPLNLRSYPVLVADATTLFVSGVFSVPLAGGTPASLGLFDLPFALKDDVLYGVQSRADVNDPNPGAPRGALLVRAPRTGGTWQPAQALGYGAPFEIRIVGDRYFVASHGLVGPVPGADDPSWRAVDPSLVRVVTGVLGSSAPPTLIIDTKLYPPFYPPTFHEFLWAVTSSAVYWSNDGIAIYSRSLSDLQ